MTAAPSHQIAASRYAEDGIPLRRLTGWGRTAPTVARVVPVNAPDDVVAAVAAAPAGGAGRGVLARGLGRSYGDAAQNSGGVVLDMTTFDRVIGVDTDQATVHVEAGASLDALSRALVPLGLWLPVVPGTRQVTVGGAIAADVHGKNHHVAGSFGRYVLEMDLVTADGTVRTLTPDGPESELFWATVGGMGLTGILLHATLACSRVESAYVLVDTERARDLDDLLQRLSADDDAYPYSVAWFDALATGRSLGRAVITRARGARLDDLPPKLARRPLEFEPKNARLPTPALPAGVVNRVTGRAFNELWYRKAPARRVAEVQHINPFFHPLDAVADWNRVYGPRGFCQYQFVVPFGAVDAFRQAVQMIAASRHPSCLNVLKRMGPSSPGPLSFPAPGWTLAVDLPVATGLDRLFRRLDDLVLSAGGRVYLAKDARLSADMLAAMYPRLGEFRVVCDKVDPDGIFSSDLARRTHL